MTRAEQLGNTEREDPLCIYKDDKGIQYLTGADITVHLRVICKLVTPNMSDTELKLISTHSIRVYACVLLSKSGKDSIYIKLRLRWLSNCFEIYLRNTDNIAVQYGNALEDAHSCMIAYAISLPNISNVVHFNGNCELTLTELEDED